MGKHLSGQALVWVGLCCMTLLAYADTTQSVTLPTTAEDHLAMVKQYEEKSGYLSSRSG